METRKLLDFYELTMTYCDLKEKKDNTKYYYDTFFRKNVKDSGYNILGGLQEIVETILNFRFEKEDIEYLRSLKTFDEEFLTYLSNFKFKGDIYAMPNGTAIFPNEPCITVVGDAIETKLIETDLLNSFNHGSLITTKATRITSAADGRGVMEFGARRAQGKDAAIVGAKHAYIGGCIGTSCYETGKRYGVPILGTMAHSFIQEHDTEYEAFLHYAKVFPNDAVFLVDTYDTLKSGVANSIRVAKDYLIPNGYRLKGIRLDSGDLAYLSKEARKMLDKAELNDCKICVSNSLDETLITDLLNQGAPIDSFGVGENLITAKDCPVFGGVYKLVAVENDNVITPKIKISDNIAKITNPSYKKVYRFYDKETGYALGDVIALANERINEETYTLIDPEATWKQTKLENYIVKELQQPIILNGELVYQFPTIEQSRKYCQEQLKTLYPEVRRKSNPHKYYVDLSEELLQLKQQLLEGNGKVKSLGSYNEKR